LVNILSSTKFDAKMKKTKVIISGAGLAGSLLASCMAKHGFEVEVFERRADMRKGTVEGGRSINLALSNRGIKALQKIDMAVPVLKEAIPMSGRMMHSVNGDLAYQPYGVEGQCINSVSRSGLNLKLIEYADTFPNVKLNFSSKVVHADFDKTSITIENDKGLEETHYADFIVSADGAFSPIRNLMQKYLRFNYSQNFENYGYKELEIQPNEDGSFKLDKNALHIWPRGEFMMIALPNPDGSFTCTLFMPYEGEVSFEKLISKNEVNAFFNKYFADILPLVQNLEEMFFKNPIGSLVTIRCNPWVRGKFALLGDSAHAIVPFYGQGMNAAFEDVAVLDSLIKNKQEETSWEEVLEEYQKERIVNANAIADLALQNFIEMRDLVAKPEFLEFKRVENLLCKHFPEKFKSQYELVTFSDLSYSLAQKSGEANSKLINYLIENQLVDMVEKKNEIESAMKHFNIQYAE
jgi:kynurenine 3-monooxygenase